jgi:hypothetical protein
MMQAAEPRHGNNLCALHGVGRRLAAYRSLLIQADMRPILMAITNVLEHELFQMAFIRHNHVIADRVSESLDTYSLTGPR